VRGENILKMSEYLNAKKSRSGVLRLFLMPGFYRFAPE
jgi:hypothetical protein